MNKIFSIFIFIGILCFISCNQLKHKRPKVQVRLTTVIRADANRVSNDSLYTLDTDYFEIGLFSAGGGTRYIAQKDIQVPKSLEDFKLIMLCVVDSSSSPVSFNNSTDFLNYMSERGYEMKDQQKFDLHTDYTFVKKQN